MNESHDQFSRLLLGEAAVALRPDLPRTVKERLFEAAPAEEFVRTIWRCSFTNVIRERLTRVS